MGIGLPQQSARCSNSASESGKKLRRLESAINTEGELIQIGLIFSTASMISTNQKRLEIPYRDMYPLEITNFILRSIYRHILNLGKVGNTEVDFIAKKGDSLHYYQVAASLTEESTFKREIAPLQAITDNHPKTILTLDRFTTGNYDGIIVSNVIDWLLG